MGTHRRKASRPRNRQVQTETKRQTTRATFVSATVSGSDRAYRSAANGPLSAIMARANSWSMMCAKANAQSVADQTMRLYRRTSGSGIKRSKSLTDIRTRRYLMDPVYGAGRKAANYANTSEDYEEVTSHPMLDLIRKPNPEQTGPEFWKLGALYRELSGNEFVFQVQGGRRDEPTELYQMAPQHTRVIIGLTEFVDGYAYGRAGATEATFKPDEVQHFRFDLNPFNPYYGCGPLHDILQEVDIYAAANQNELSRWENGARPDFVINLKDNATDEQVEQIRAQLNAEFRGVDNVGKFLIATSSQVQPLQFSPKDMEYLAGKRDLRIAIFCAFGIPEAYIELNSANLSGALTADTQYLRRTIRPRINQRAEELTEWLLPLFGLKPGDYWLAYDNPVPEDKEQLRAENVAYVSAGIRTLDEARSLDGYEPYADGLGALPRVNGLPVAAAPAPTEGAAADPEPADAVAAPAEVDAVQDTALNGAQVASMLAIVSQVTAGALPVDTARALIVASFPTLSEAQVSAIVGPLENFKPAAPPTEAKPPEPESKDPPEPPVEKSAAACCGKSKGGELDLGADGDALRDELVKGLQGWYESAASKVAVGDDLSVSLSALTDDLEKRLFGTLSKVFQSGGQQGLSELAEVDGGAELLEQSGLSFDVVPEQAIAFLKRYTVKLADSTVSALEATLGQEARAAIEGLSEQIADGMSQGEALSAVTSRVKDSLQLDASWRAERIARTETSRAYSAGKVQAWKEAGVKRKRFLLAPDSCPICKGFASQFNEAHDIDRPFLAVGESFKDSEGNEVANDYLDIDGPPVHPQCRCTVVPVLE
jgi:HK97 family phage portal protein